MEARSLRLDLPVSSRYSFYSLILKVPLLTSFEYQIPFENPKSPSLFIQVTHPRIIFAMGFLVSSVAKRDPVGRKPKRKVFATEGLTVLEREAKQEVESNWIFVVGLCYHLTIFIYFTVPPWASVSDLREIEGKISQIKADLMCELIGVSFPFLLTPKIPLNSIFYPGRYLSKRI